VKRTKGPAPFAGASIAHAGFVHEYVSNADAVNEGSLHKAINLGSGLHRTGAYLRHEPGYMQLRRYLRAGRAKSSHSGSRPFQMSRLRERTNFGEGL
jgi:hypothetical protein